MSASTVVRPWPRERPPEDGGGRLRGVPGGRDTGGAVARLDSLRAAGLVRRASERVGEGVEHGLPVAAVLRPLLPGGCLRRGGIIAISTGGTAGSEIGSMGATSLLFALLAEASTAGSWCAAVGLPRLGLVAAAEAGVAVQRFALVPHPGPDWVEVVGALIDGLDIVVLAAPGGAAPQLATRIAARARQRGTVLIAMGTWPGADVALEVVHGVWHGLGQGSGRLRRREVEVVVSGRGAAARSRRARLWLPDATGAAAAMTPAVELTSRQHDRAERRWAS